MVELRPKSPRQVKSPESPSDIKRENEEDNTNDTHNRRELVRSGAVGDDVSAENTACSPTALRSPSNGGEEEILSQGLVKMEVDMEEKTTLPEQSLSAQQIETSMDTAEGGDFSSDSTETLIADEMLAPSPEAEDFSQGAIYF